MYSVAHYITDYFNLKVFICISDEPEIEVDKSWVHGGLGYEAVISCIVYGDPVPSVRWYRDTMVVAGNENRIMEQFGFR